VIKSLYRRARSYERLRRWRRSVSHAHIDKRVELTGCAQGRLADIQLGAGAILERDVIIWLPPREDASGCLQIDGDVFVGRGTHLAVFESIRIGRHTLIGAYSYIVSSRHRFDRRDIPIWDQGLDGERIDIAGDVWIGTHCVVLPGVVIDRGAVVAAGSVVTKHVPAYQVWGGVPARFIKDRPE
jgi:acetyltransferase-like isoleucine patch superfamily enzyme